MWSKRYFPVLVTIGCIICMSTISGQTSAYPGYWRPKFEGFFDVNDTNSVPVVDRMNQYNVMKEMLYLTYQIEDAADNRIHFEFHLGGSATFDSENGQIAAITLDTGTIHLRVPNSGRRTMEMFREAPAANIDLTAGSPLSELTNPTDWRTLLNTRVEGL